MVAPANPKIYHIVHVDRLSAIQRDGYLWSDAEIIRRQAPGTTIGMNSIKTRRQSLAIACRPGLVVGKCVPFYFCPRSIMLYLISQANHPELSYRGGQGPIVHLEADLHQAVNWAEENDRRWAFTLSNAGAFYFEDRCDLDQLDEIDWAAVAAHRWSGPTVSRSVKEGKQAEFLSELSFPWHLVERIGVQSVATAQKVANSLAADKFRPATEIHSEWYY